MSIYEKRFYEDFHKLVIIQGKILKELQKMNEPLQVDADYNNLIAEKIPMATVSELEDILGHKNIKESE